tara:strand:+ start:1209 stop:1388 length:180 start_codon:yes stop_codon:yes gene_type:complete
MLLGLIRRLWSSFGRVERQEKVIALGEEAESATLLALKHRPKADRYSTSSTQLEVAGYP